MKFVFGFTVLIALINAGFSLWEKDLGRAAAWISAVLGWLVALMGVRE
jgi:hydrogenase/urease accessory protein HupE